MPDLLSDVQVASFFMLALSEDPSGILIHPAISYATADGGSSSVVSVPVLGLSGNDLLAARTAGVEVSSTTFTSSSIDVTVAPYALRYGMDDFAGLLTNGLFDAQKVGGSLASSYVKSMFGLVATASTGFTRSVGATGDPLTWTNIIEAKAAIRATNGAGVPMCVLAPAQWGQLEKDALTQTNPAEKGLEGAFIQSLGTYQGRYMGVDFFVSNQVPTANAGADYSGIMAVAGAFAVADIMQTPAFSVSNGGINLNRAWLDFGRNGSFGSSDMTIHATMGAASGIDGAAVKLISSVTV
jgi:hypothetical protein